MFTSDLALSRSSSRISHACILVLLLFVVTTHLVLVRACAFRSIRACRRYALAATANISNSSTYVSVPVLSLVCSFFTAFGLSSLPHVEGYLLPRPRDVGLCTPLHRYSLTESGHDPSLHVSPAV